MKHLLFASLFILFSACSYTPDTIVLQPKPHARALVIPVGNDQPILVRVLNGLPSNRIGEYGKKEGSKAPILVSDLVVPIQKELMDGLKRKAFKPQKTGNANLLLEATIQYLSYKSTAGMVTKDKSVYVEMGVHAKNSERYINKRYFAEVKGEGLEVDMLTKRPIEIDTVLSDILTQILNDDALMSFLGS